MSEWKSFEIPGSLVGERRESKSAYVTTYQTEILLPKASEYAGYSFWHPSKLVGGTFSVAKITYTDEFSFVLVKKEREPGKRYKRYKLTASELIQVYAPETARVKAKQEKKEAARLAQIGSVEIVPSEAKARRLFLFHCGKQYYYGSGTRFGGEKDVTERKVLAGAVPRSVFESAYEELCSLWESYRMILDVREAVGKFPCHPGSKVDEVGDSFDSLCNRWDDEFCETARGLIGEKASAFTETCKK